MEIDLLITFFFFTACLLIGIFLKDKTQTVQEFAIGGRNYPLPVLVSTITATIIGSESSFSLAEQIYQIGLVYLIVFVGFAINKVVIAYLIAPKMYKYRNLLSIGDIMECYYGRFGKVFTGLCGTIACILIIAAQISAFGFIAQVFFGYSREIGIIVSSIIVVIYCYFGGIKAVTYTDVLQFAIAIIVIPIVANIAVSEIGGWHIFLEIGVKSDSVQILSHPKIFSYLALMLIFSIPSLDSAVTQRLLMAKNAMQIKRSLLIAAIVSIYFYLMIGVIAQVAFIKFPSINPSLVIPYMIEVMVPQGLKWFAILGLIAIIMSTVDSYVNAGSINFVHDFLKPLIGKEMDERSELTMMRLVTIIIGFAATIFAISSESIISLIMHFLNLWYPFIVVPLFAGILGFVGSRKSMLIGLSGGAIGYLLWDYLSLTERFMINETLPSMFSNLIFFITGRYFLGEMGKRDKLADSMKIYEEAAEPKPSQQSNTELLLSKKKSLPAKDWSSKLVNDSIIDYSSLYVVFGVFIIFTYVSPFFMWHGFENNFINVTLRVAAFCLSFLLIIKDFWPRFLQKYLTGYWNVTILFCLPLMSTYNMLAADLSWQYIINTALSLLVMALLVDWRQFIWMLIIGSGTGMSLYLMFDGNINSLNFERFPFVFYIYLFTSFTAFLFARRRDLLYKEIISLQRIHNDELEHKVQERTDELAKALSVKTDFLNNISHEVRTPIHGIAAISVGLMEKWQEYDDPQRYNLICRIAESSDRIKSLVNNILDLSKIQRGELAYEFEPVDINQLIDDMVKECRNLYLLGKDLTIEYYPCQENIVLRVDANRITQVLRNIFTNAIKFSTHGQITVTNLYTPDHKFLQIEIEDEGPGIPEDELKSIFDAFVQSSKTKTGAGGTGLGLKICQEIIEHHGGKIWAANTPRGAKFIFTLPISEDLTNTIIMPVHKDKEEDGGKQALKGEVNVLFVDDEEMISMSAELMLSNSNYKLIIFNKWEEALSYLEKDQNVDIILLDYMMPGILGEEMINRIREVLKTNIPIVIQSGLGEDQILAAARKKVQGYIIKPYTKQELVSVLNKALTGAKANR